jgi:hypothetical protein
MRAIIDAYGLPATRRGFLGRIIEYVIPETANEATVAADMTTHPAPSVTER